MTEQSGSFLAHVCAGPVETPSAETLADLMTNLESSWGERPADPLGQALVWAVQRRAPVWSKIRAVCLVAGQAPSDLEPQAVMDGLWRVRHILSEIGRRGITSRGYGLEEKGERLTEPGLYAMFERDRFRVEGVDMPVPLIVICATAGVLAYAIRRTEISGVPCLGVLEELRIAWWLVLWYHDNRPDIHSTDARTVDLLEAIDRARERAAKDVQAGRPEPFLIDVNSVAT